MFQRLFPTVLMLLSAVLVSACSSVTPARFQRGFTVGGVIHETTIDADGEASHFMVTGTPMEKLFTKYLKENPSSVLFVGFFLFLFKFHIFFLSLLYFILDIIGTYYFLLF